MGATMACPAEKPATRKPGYGWRDEKLSCFAGTERFCVCCNDHYNSFPDLVCAPDDTLVCAWRPGDDHIPQKYSALAVATSTDNGKSWSVPLILEESHDAGKLVWDCPSLSVLKDGRIAMVVNTTCNRRQGSSEKTAEHKLFMWLSNDNGRSWGKRLELPFGGMCPGKLLELRDGAWLVTSHHSSIICGEPRLVQYAWRSEDCGSTWSEAYIIASDSSYNFCEASVVELSDGTLVAYMREDSRKGVPMFKSISHDGGRNWKFFRTNIAAGHRPRAGLLKNGKIFVSYRLYNHCMQVGGNTFAYVEDEWSSREPDWTKQHGRAFPLACDYSILSDGGYTGWIQNPDSTLTLVNYGCGSQPMPWIYGIRFDPELFCKSLRHKNTFA